LVDAAATLLDFLAFLTVAFGAFLELDFLTVAFFSLATLSALASAVAFVAPGVGSLSHDQAPSLNPQLVPALAAP
jgi:hypothetical protein